jgi:hypothetical protein
VSKLLLELLLLDKIVVQVLAIVEVFIYGRHRDIFLLTLN